MGYPTFDKHDEVATLRRRNKIAMVVAEAQRHELDLALAATAERQQELIIDGQVDAQVDLGISARSALAAMGKVIAAMGGVEDLEALGLAGNVMATRQVLVIQEANPVW